MNYTVYILECQGNRYYTGYTSDLATRYQQHVDGSGKCKFTRSFPPKRIAASWQFASKSEALQVEYAIKQLSRAEKRRLIGGEIPVPTR